MGYSNWSIALLELGPVVALDAAADAAAARVVRHQHDVAAGQRDEGGQRRALVAALFLLDLDQQFLAFPDRVADAGLGDRHALGEVALGDFLERQEAVAVFAVVDEAGFERRLDPRHHRLVDVALALFAPFDFDFVVEEFLSVDDRQPAFFRLRGVDQHPLHSVTFFFANEHHRPMTGQRCLTDASKRMELPGMRRGRRVLTRQAWQGRVDGGEGRAAERRPVVPQELWRVEPAERGLAAMPCLRRGL